MDHLLLLAFLVKRFDNCKKSDSMMIHPSCTRQFSLTLGPHFTMFFTLGTGLAKRSSVLTNNFRRFTCQTFS